MKKENQFQNRNAGYRLLEKVNLTTLFLLRTYQIHDKQQNINEVDKIELLSDNAAGS